MADVFDEISDDLRREELKQFWKENGSWIVGGAIAAVILTAGLSFWRHWEHKRNTAATTELSRLVSGTDVSRLEAFAKDTTKNHAMVAKFMAASKHLERGEKKQAIALYNEIAATNGLDKTWRDLAGILSVSHRLEQDPPARLEKELERYAGNTDTWRYTAWELQALLWSSQGELKKAADKLSRIAADPLAPSDARARAMSLRELYLASAKK